MLKILTIMLASASFYSTVKSLLIMLDPMGFYSTLQSLAAGHILLHPSRESVKENVIRNASSSYTISLVPSMAVLYADGYKMYKGQTMDKITRNTPSPKGRFFPKNDPVEGLGGRRLSEAPSLPRFLFGVVE
jgi:hypothetical protein